MSSKFDVFYLNYKSNASTVLDPFVFYKNIFEGL